MFERAVILNPGRIDGNIDVGRILETMLYYRHVELIADGRMVPSLWRQLGPENTAALLHHPNLVVAITPEVPGIQNETKGGVRTHRPITLTASGNKENTFSPKDTARAIHQQINNSIPTDLSLVRKVLKGIQDTRYIDVFSNTDAHISLFESLIDDDKSMQMFLLAYGIRKGYTIS